MPRDDDHDDDRDDDYRPRRGGSGGGAPRSRRRFDDDAPDPTGGLIPLRNGLALAAYYCGVFSFVPCFAPVLGPLAMIFGFLGLARANKHPEAKGKGHSIAGIICGGLTTLLALTGIVFLAVMSATAK